MRPSEGDEWTERLDLLFRNHPAWIAAARHLGPQSSSTIYFEHRGREPWQLELNEGASRLRRGAAPDPDLVFHFTPESISRLEAVDGGMGDFATTLFSLIVDDEVGFRIVASFGRLARRGYVKLLLAAGPKIIAFGVAHGVASLGALRRLVAQLRARGPRSWEEGGGPSPEGP